MLRPSTELLADLFDHAKSVIIRSGIANDHDAEQIASDLCSAISEAWGGQIIYVGKEAQFRVARRDAELWRDFTGDNHPELAAKYNISVQTVYRRLAIIRSAIEADTQLDLLSAPQSEETG